MEDARANLFIVGAAKCGTTSLYEYLSQHPEIYMSPVKEPHFFSDKVESLKKEMYELPVKGEKCHTRIIQSIERYSTLFEDGKDFKIRGEASPSYLWDEDSAKKIYSYNADAKIIILLRDPVNRLISQYQMAQALNLHDHYNSSFLDMIKFEFEKEKKIWGIDHIYIDLGFYYKQISKYTFLFPQDQILILKFEDFITEKKQTLKKVFQFLQVNENIIETFNLEEQYNTTAHPRFSFIKAWRKNRNIKKLIGYLGTNKHILKNLIYKKGYDPRKKIDEETKVYLKEVYKCDLQKLKEFYNIEF